MLLTRSAEQIVYKGYTGMAKVYHGLDRATALAREVGFRNIRVEEDF